MRDRDLSHSYLFNDLEHGGIALLEMSTQRLHRTFSNKFGSTSDWLRVLLADLALRVSPGGHRPGYY